MKDSKNNSWLREIIKEIINELGLATGSNPSWNQGPVRRKNALKSTKRSVLTEVRVYEKIVLDLSRRIINQLKSTVGKNSKKIYNASFKRHIVRIEVEIFPIDVELEVPGKSPQFSVNAGVVFSHENLSMSVDIVYTEEFLKKNFNYIVAELKDALRHEFEHINQIVFGFANKDMEKRYADVEDDYSYLMLPTEIPAMVRGLYKRAKTQRTNLEDMIYSYVRSFGMKSYEEKHVIDTYINYANKVHLPLRVNEEQLDEITLQQYATYQVAVAQAVAKKLHKTPDDLIMNTNFAKLYADLVDRNKEQIPSVDSVASKIIKQL